MAFLARLKFPLKYLYNHYFLLFRRYSPYKIWKKRIDNACFFTFFTTLGLIWPKFCPKTTPTSIYFAGFQWNMLRDSIFINNFNWNWVFWNFFAKTLKNYHFLAQLLQKWGPHLPCPKQKTTIFFCWNNKNFKKLFILLKCHIYIYIYIFWRSYVFLFVWCFFAKKCNFQPWQL